MFKLLIDITYICPNPHQNQHRGNREDMLATAHSSSVPANSQSALVDDPDAWRSS